MSGEIAEQKYNNMAQFELKFLVTFRKTDYNEHTIKKNIYDFFYKYKEDEKRSCIVNIGVQKNIDVDELFKANLCEIEVSLEYNNSDSELNINEEFKAIYKKWCGKNYNNLAHLWLRLAKRSLLENSGEPHHCNIDVKEIGFGTTPDMNLFVEHCFCETVSPSTEIVASFFHNQKYFQIDVRTAHVQGKRKNKQYKRCRFKVPYEAITRVVIDNDADCNDMFLYFYMQHIPLVFREIQVKIKGRKPKTKWERSTSYECSCPGDYCCAIEDIGRCQIFKIVIPKDFAYNIVERLMQRCAPRVHFNFSYMASFYPETNLVDFETFPVSEQYFLSIADEKVVSDIKFKCQYAWNVVHSRSLVVRDQIDIISRIRENYWEEIKIEIMRCMEHKDALISALYHISDLISRQEVFEFGDALHQLFNNYKDNPITNELPVGMCVMRSMIIMPSRILYLQPKEHFENRVIREFGCENIVRVSILDDNFSNLTFAVQYNSNEEEFLGILKNKLNDGIKIGPRKYEVLASSCNQLREHGLYMFAKNHDGITADKIRDWMGDFSQIKNVAKYMARLGQCFSTSDEAAQVRLDDHEVINLAEVESNGYVFSDGCGTISFQIAEEIRENFKNGDPARALDECPRYEPSAYQIRFKGCKGMVAIDPSLKGRKLGKRPSMEKFICENSNVLEIVKISAPRAVFLNRPLIAILEQLGVPSIAFKKLQNAMAVDMIDSLVDDRIAFKLLKNRTGLNYPFKQLFKSGVILSEEPFFRRLLLSIYTLGFDMLRSKSRIAIPPKYGRNMLGVIDETNTLKYGEVFVQCSKEIGTEENWPTMRPLRGTVLVTKNPCMHPGDVRKLKAVDVKELHHIKDCIVFPSKGPRPHPDEMAGSDLDGDEFVVIWHKDLIFDRKNHEAMDYPSNEEKKHDGPIKVSDMVNFLCEYIQNGNIGVMASAHLVWSDSPSHGIFSEVCASIAEKYPRALDFAKSGTTEKLEFSEKPKNYPDFMEKGSHNSSYKSTRVLGNLYRDIRALEAYVCKIDISKEEITLDENLVYPGWQQYESVANNYRNRYASRIKLILKKFDLPNETEVLSGNVRKSNEYRENEHDWDNTLSVARTYIKDTIKRYRNTFFRVCGEINKIRKTQPTEITQFKMASAWYIVTYRCQEKSILSFPWVVSDILCNMRVSRLKSSCILTVNTFITSSNSKLFSIYSQSMTSNSELCRCYLILIRLIAQWMKICSLTSTIPCSDCQTRILMNFSMMCCAENNCDCSNQCSPVSLVLKFFKFYAYDEFSSIGLCSDSNCNGFKDAYLQSAALKSFANLLLTRDINTLIETDSNTDQDWEDCEEGDPIRVPVGNEDAYFFEYHKEEMEEILKSKSGVKKVFIVFNNHSWNSNILVHSIGKPHQRWALEELIMNGDFITLIRPNLNLSESENSSMDSSYTDSI